MNYKCKRGIIGITNANNLKKANISLIKPYMGINRQFLKDKTQMSEKHLHGFLSKIQIIFFPYFIEIDKLGLGRGFSV